MWIDNIIDQEIKRILNGFEILIYICICQLIEETIGYDVTLVKDQRRLLEKSPFHKGIQLSAPCGQHLWPYDVMRASSCRVPDPTSCRLLARVFAWSMTTAGSSGVHDSPSGRRQSKVGSCVVSSPHSNYGDCVVSM